MTDREDEKNESEPIQMTKGDHAHTGVRAIISAIPVVGGPFEVIFSKYYPSPIDKRRDNLLQSVAEGLEKLKGKYEGLTPEFLVKNDVFVTVLLNAVSIAIKSHQKEKLEALRNAVLNTALKIDIDEDMQVVFLRYVDDLTPLHMKMLALLEGPEQYMERAGRPFPKNIISTGLDGMIEHAIPELHKKHEHVRVVFQDLYNYSLINTKPDVLGASMTVGRSGIFAQRTTDIAREFLRYISAPQELEKTK